MAAKLLTRGVRPRTRRIRTLETVFLVHVLAIVGRFLNVPVAPMTFDLIVIGPPAVTVIRSLAALVFRIWELLVALVVFVRKAKHVVSWPRSPVARSTVVVCLLVYRRPGLGNVLTLLPTLLNLVGVAAGRSVWTWVW